MLNNGRIQEKQNRTTWQLHALTVVIPTLLT